MTELRNCALQVVADRSSRFPRDNGTVFSLQRLSPRETRCCSHPHLGRAGGGGGEV